MWYPDADFVMWVHSVMLERFGGHGGFERGIGVFDFILQRVKAESGLYRQAAVLLRELVSCRIFADGNHRTAFEVTKTFLEMNGGMLVSENLADVVRFIKSLNSYNVEEIEKWLKYGKVP